MATKKQKREAAEAKHAAYVAQEKADGLRALEYSREQEIARSNALVEKARAENQRLKEIIEEGLAELGEDHLMVRQYRKEMAVLGYIGAMSEWNKHIQYLINDRRVEEAQRADRWVFEEVLPQPKPKTDTLTAIQRIKLASDKKKYEDGFTPIERRIYDEEQWRLLGRVSNV